MAETSIRAQEMFRGNYGVVCGGKSSVSRSKKESRETNKVIGKLTPSFGPWRKLRESAFSA
jgi:hypothetical protein